MKGIIYCIERIETGKKYIGQTTKSLDEYWGSGVYIGKAIQKYGKSAFKKYVLEECSIDDLNSREIYWIDKFNTFKGVGYNADNGGKSNSGYWANIDSETKNEIHLKRLKKQTS